MCSLCVCSRLRVQAPLFHTHLQGSIFFLTSTDSMIDYLLELLLDLLMVCMRQSVSQAGATLVSIECSVTMAEKPFTQLNFQTLSLSNSSAVGPSIPMVEWGVCTIGKGIWTHYLQKEHWDPFSLMFWKFAQPFLWIHWWRGGTVLRLIDKWHFPSQSGWTPNLWILNHYKS